MENQVASRFTKMRDAFKALDSDQSGSISRQELQRGLHMWNLGDQSGNDELIDSIMAACDKDGSGGIDYKEFVDCLSRDKRVGNAVALAAVKETMPKQSMPKRPASPRSRVPSPALINAKNAVHAAELAVSSRFKNVHQAAQHV